MNNTDNLTPGGGPTRRTVLASVGLAGVGMAALGACGAAQETAGDVASTATDAVKEAISAATIPVGGGKIFADQKLVVTQPSAGEFKAFSAVCTHQGCVLREIADGTINCPTGPCGHGSKFDVATGAVRNGPATQPLVEKKLTISGDGITVS